jgi:hypothetical protein
LLFSNRKLVRIMTAGRYEALIVSLGAMALMFGANETLAAPAGQPHGVTAPTHSFNRPPGAPPFRHHRRNGLGTYFWPGGDYSYGYGPSGEPVGNIGQPPSNDAHYTYTYDVPWDWAHRYPPNVVPSDRPYVPSCGTEAVTVPGRGGDQSINIMRCY